MKPSSHSSRRQPGPRGGLYVIVLWLGRRASVAAGARDGMVFAPGTYLYIGSAARALAARLARHKAVSKKLRWHIDYFRQKASWAGAAVFPIDVGECRLAALAAAALDGRIAALRFGASDCRCPGHLIVTQMRPAAALEALCQMGGQPWAEAQGEVAASGW